MIHIPTLDCKQTLTEYTPNAFFQYIYMVYTRVQMYIIYNTYNIYA